MRFDHHHPADLLDIVVSASGLSHYPLSSPSTLDCVPDCLIVSRILKEYETQPIRQYNIHGYIPPGQRASHTPYELPRNGDSSQEPSHLEGRPLLVSRLLYASLEHVLLDYSTPSSQQIDGKTLTLTPERIRRMIDAVVLCLAFQSTVQLNGLRPLAECSQTAGRILEKVVATVRNTTFDTPALFLIWTSMQPLISASQSVPEVWPVLLRPHSGSGIRKDLLSRWNDDMDQGAETLVSHLQRAIWRFEIVSSACTVYGTDVEASRISHSSRYFGSRP